MQPYYVASTDALKKRIKQFHAELKKHKDDITLGWCRDFVSKLLFWDSWNELHKAHQKEVSQMNNLLKATFFSIPLLLGSASVKAEFIPTDVFQF